MAKPRQTARALIGDVEALLLASLANGGSTDHNITWWPEDITFDIVADDTDHPVVTVLVRTPIGALFFIG